MPTPRLRVLAGISLALLAVLLCGLFATMGPAIDWYTAINAGTAGLRVAEMKLDRGELRIVIGEVPVRVKTAQVPAGVHVEPLFKNANPGLPMPRRALWEFEARALRGGGFILACPIWCVAIPCAIAPIEWLRRRRHDARRGFAVETLRSERL